MLQKLEQLENLAKGSKLSRLLNSPIRYINAMFFSKFLYPKSKIGRMVQCDTFFGATMNVVLPAGMDIFLLGGKSHSSEIRLAKLLIKSLKKGDIFLDIGAHFGYFSLLASTLVAEDGKVYCIEASKEIHAVLKKNTAENRNIEVFHTACTDENKTISFYEFPILFSEYNTLAPEQYESASWLQGNEPTKLEVQGRTADSIIEEIGSLPDFIKIDVEGAEHMVISGMKSNLMNAKNLQISMEYLQDARVNTSHFQAAELLSELGYAAHVITEDGGIDLIETADISPYLQQNNLESDNIVFKRA